MSSQVVEYRKLGLELALWNFKIHTLFKPDVIPSSCNQTPVLGSTGNGLRVGDWFVESSLGSAANIGAYGRLTKAGLVRGRSCTVVQSQRPHPILQGTSE